MTDDAAPRREYRELYFVVQPVFTRSSVDGEPEQIVRADPREVVGIAGLRAYCEAFPRYLRDFNASEAP